MGRLRSVSVATDSGPASAQERRRTVANVMVMEAVDRRAVAVGVAGTISREGMAMTYAEGMKLYHRKYAAAMKEHTGGVCERAHVVAMEAVDAFLVATMQSTAAPSTAVTGRTDAPAMTMERARRELGDPHDMIMAGIVKCQARRCAGGGFAG